MEASSVDQLHDTTPEELAGGRADPVIQALQESKQQGCVWAIGLSFRNGRAGEALYPAGFGFKYIEDGMGRFLKGLLWATKPP